MLNHREISKPDRTVVAAAIVGMGIIIISEARP